MIINNKLLDKEITRKKSSIGCRCSANTTSNSTTTPTKLPFSEYIKTGSKLSLSNNRIYAEKDCTVIIFTQIYITSGITANTNGVILNILKNGSQFSRSLNAIPSNWRTCSCSGVIINLSAGDYIEVGFHSGDKTGITVASGENTFITVKEI